MIYFFQKSETGWFKLQLHKLNFHDTETLQYVEDAMLDSIWAKVQERKCWRGWLKKQKVHSMLCKHTHTHSWGDITVSGPCSWVTYFGILLSLKEEEKVLHLAETWWLLSLDDCYATSRRDSLKCCLDTCLYASQSVTKMQQKSPPYSQIKDFYKECQKIWVPGVDTQRSCFCDWSLAGPYWIHEGNMIISCLFA